MTEYRLFWFADVDGHQGVPFTQALAAERFPSMDQIITTINRAHPGHRNITGVSLYRGDQRLEPRWEDIV